MVIIWSMILNNMVYQWLLVGGVNPSEKWWSSSVGMMTFHILWKVIKAMFQTTNQSKRCSLHQFPSRRGFSVSWRCFRRWYLYSPPLVPRRPSSEKVDDSGNSNITLIYTYIYNYIYIYMVCMCIYIYMVCVYIYIYTYMVCIYIYMVCICIYG